MDNILFMNGSNAVGKILEAIGYCVPILVDSTQRFTKVLEQTLSSKFEYKKDAILYNFITSSSDCW